MLREARRGAAVCFLRFFRGGRHRSKDAVHRRNRFKIHTFVEQGGVYFTNAQVRETFGVRNSKNRRTFGTCESTRRLSFDFLKSAHARLNSTLHRRARYTKYRAGLSHADRFGQGIQDFFDRSSSGALSLAIICKSACDFPSASTIISAFAARRSRRAFSLRSFSSSVVNGFAR